MQELANEIGLRQGFVELANELGLRDIREGGAPNGFRHVGSCLGDSMKDWPEGKLREVLTRKTPYGKINGYFIEYDIGRDDARYHLVIAK